MPVRSTEDLHRFRAAFDASYVRVRRILQALGLDRATAEDGAQQVFVVLARRLSEVEEGKEAAFVAACAYRVASRLRARRVDAPFVCEPADPTPLPDELVEVLRSRLRLRRILATLPAALREVFELAHLDDCSKGEIAALLAIPEGTVASRLRRARAIVSARIVRGSVRFDEGGPRHGVAGAVAEQAHRRTPPAADASALERHASVRTARGDA